MSYDLIFSKPERNGSGNPDFIKQFTSIQLYVDDKCTVFLAQRVPLHTGNGQHGCRGEQWNHLLPHTFNYVLESQILNPFPFKIRTFPVKDIQVPFQAIQPRSPLTSSAIPRLFHFVFFIPFYLIPKSWYSGTSTSCPVTKRPVTKRPVTKRPFTKRPVTERPGSRTSRLPNVHFTKRLCYQPSSLQNVQVC